jgi:hypothetical protein
VNREDALALLKQYASSYASWHGHCLQVGTASRCLAELISQRGHAVDAERATVSGLLHDLGRSRGHDLRHGIEGYLLARAEGHEEEGRMCLVHILKGRTLEQGIELGMLTEEERQELQESGQQFERLSLEERIACVADAMMSDTGLASIEEKYANARRRYGGRPHHYEDEAWVTGVAAELAELLGEAPYEVLKRRTVICYGDYPTRLVAVNILGVLAALAVGVIIIAQFGLWAVLGYAMIALLAVVLSLAFGCARCHYYGRVCGTGLGKIACLIVDKRDEEEFGKSLSQMVSWTLVGVTLLLPIAAGLISVREGFTFARLLWLVAFLVVMVVALVTHSRFACNRCRQAEEDHCTLGRLGKPL